MTNRIYKILFVARDDGGCGYFRCLQPATFLNRAGLAQATHVFKQPTTEQILNSDLVVMQEMGFSNSLAIAQLCIKNKIPYIVEIDDFLHHISPHNTAGYGAWNPSTLCLYRAIELLKLASGATVSTNQLAREYFPYNNTIYIVPNYLNKDKWDNPKKKQIDKKIRIGWFGGNAHADDLFMISGVIDKITKKFKNRVVFETMGMLKEELKGVFPLQEFSETCPNCGYEGNIHYRPGETLENYPLMLASKGWDIGLAPVINNSFGNSKSDLKIKEYAAAGLPIIASNVVPYLEAAKNGAQIIFAETFEEWYNNIKELINNPAKRDEMTVKNKEWVSKYWIQDNIYKTFEVYRQIISRFELLSGKIKQ